MSGVSHDIAFSDMIFFATGVHEIPPWGFCPKPSLEFLHEGDAESVSSTFPKANTCTYCLMLPVGHTSWVVWGSHHIWNTKCARIWLCIVCFLYTCSQSDTVLKLWCIIYHTDRRVSQLYAFSCVVVDHWLVLFKIRDILFKECIAYVEGV